MLAEASLLTFNGTVIVQAVIFLVTAALLYRFAWGPLVRQIQARNDKIEAGLRSAAEAEQRLRSASADIERQLDEARRQAREILSRAHSEATADAEEVRARARREAEAQVERARADIAVERDRALQELRTQVGSMVVEAAGKVLGQAIDARAHERLIAEALDEVGARA